MHQCGSTAEVVAVLLTGSDAYGCCLLTTVWAPLCLNNALAKPWSYSSVLSLIGRQGSSYALPYHGNLNNLWWSFVVSLPDTLPCVNIQSSFHGSFLGMCVLFTLRCFFPITYVVQWFYGGHSSLRKNNTCLFSSQASLLVLGLRPAFCSNMATFWLLEHIF